MLIRSQLYRLRKMVRLISISCLGVMVSLPAEALPPINSADLSKQLKAHTQLMLSSDIEIGPPSYVYPTPLESIPVELETYSDGFSTFMTALKASGLNQTLSGKGPFTVFAPTNEAFAALPRGTLSRLLQPENRAALSQLLKHHIVVGKITSFNIQSDQLRTLAGSFITVKVTPETMSVDNAQVVLADISAGNGIIHGIEKVLVYPSF